MATKSPCRFFFKGYCSRGASCAFTHDAADDSTAPFAPIHSQDWRATATATLNKSPVPSSQKDSRSEISCRFYLQGNCTNGDRCPFKHSDQAASTMEEVIEVDDEEETDDYSRDLFGAVAYFEKGAQVSDVSLPSDFSAVHIKGLSLGTTPDSVAEIMAELGIEVPVTCVRTIVQDELPSISAEIRMKDPMFATDFCDKLAKARFEKGKNARLEAIQVPTSITSESSTHRVDCRSVTCSWHKPSRVAWLNFGDMNIAKRVSDKFNDGIYVVRGAKVICGEPKRSSGVRNPLVWTVFMTALLATNSETDIQLAIRDHWNKPRHIELGDPSYLVKNRQAEVIVKALLSTIGPLESFKVNNDLSAKRIKAIARYQHDVDAREAMRRLNDTPIPGLQNVKLSLRVITLAKFKIATAIYDSIKSDIDRERSCWAKHYINCSIYRNTDSAQRYTVIRIFGENRKEFGDAKDSLERILCGVIAMDDSVPIWTASFNKRSVFDEFKKIQRGLGVHIVRDKRSQLRLYGNAKDCVKAQDLLKGMAKRDSSVPHVIELDQERFRKALSGKFQSIISILGKEVASIDIASKPRKIIIMGSITDYQTALRILDSEELGAGRENKLEDLCPICCSKAENPIRTSCNHTYCLECLENQCSAAASDGKEFSINCHGNSGKCGVALTLRELQDHLSSTRFEDMLRSSFTSYIRRRPDIFRYCPTTDCEQVYRGNTPTASHTCPKCLATICNSCHVSHANMTCVEYKYEISGSQEAFEKFKKEHGFKDCPKCGMSIEKIGGCNHMTCPTCSAHICWVCLGIFREGMSVYEHMNRKHGGIGSEEDLLY